VNQHGIGNLMRNYNFLFSRRSPASVLQRALDLLNSWRSVNNTKGGCGYTCVLSHGSAGPDPEMRGQYLSRWINLRNQCIKTIKASRIYFPGIAVNLIEIGGKL